MRSLKLALIATTAIAALSTASFAADLTMDPPMTAPVIDNSFTWDGAYLGAYIAATDSPSSFGIGGDIGVNGSSDMLIYGGELSGTWYSSNDFSAQATGKLGVLVTDGAAIYGYSGVGSKTGTSWFVPLGVGAEFAVADNLSLKAEYQHNFDLTSSAQDSNTVQVGLNWHF